MSMRIILTPHQRAFIKSLETSLKPIDSILDEMKVKPSSLASWLSNKDFRKAIKNFRKRVGFISDLDIARVGRYASRQLSAIAFGEEPIDGQDARRRLLMDLAKLARSRPVRTKTKAPEAPSGPGYHETVGPEEAEELLGHLGAD
jgi:hypothetical protein